MTVAYVALGANLGDRRQNLQAALRLLPPAARLVEVSSLYETKAVTLDGEPQPLYFNAAAKLETDVPPFDLLAAFKWIERGMGRNEGAPPWSPRPIDLDLLLYGGRVIMEEGLAVPHPRMTERGFVLVPLAEIAGDVAHPASGRTIAELAADVGDEGVWRVEGPEWFAEIDG